VLGLQPHTSDYPAPGTRGAVGFGLETGAGLESLVTLHSARGVRFTSDVIVFEGGKSIALEDADGNGTYLWEQTEDVIAGQERSASDAENRAGSRAISGGHGIVFVSNMDRAVHFYSEVLGFPLTFRHEDKIAFVEAGGRLVIALHPTSPAYAPPGTRGAMRIALQVDEPIDRVVSRLAARGVRVATAKSRDRASTLIEDIDGNPIELVEEGALGRTGEEEAVSVPARGGRLETARATEKR
jgi:catechol 2,3-dioxygenase